MIDKDTFFRNVTLRMCGNLNLEEGLRDCFEYIREFIPADRVYLERHEPDLNAMHIVARADADSCERMDLLIPYTPEVIEAFKELGKAWREGTLPEVWVINRTREEPVSRCLLGALGESFGSVMSLPLNVGNQIAGALVLRADGEDRYTDEHAELFASLKEPFFVAMSNAMRHQEVMEMRNRLADDNRFLNRQLLDMSGTEIIGADFGLRDVMEQVRHVAPTDSPVLLMGETGVGKDVVANAIHLGSPRREGPFVPVNCGAIPDSMIDSELFGHEKGAFTGAISLKRGRFERAQGGTILLDEIGEMPLDAQVRLLRVIQHREVERLGGAERIPVDIRIIAATNKDLKAMVKDGTFREDLFFRLNVYPILIPPLRERSSNIPTLVHHLMHRKADELKIGEHPQLAEGAMQTLRQHRWPGNVRELENVIERAMIHYNGEPLRFHELRPSSPDATPSPAEVGEIQPLDTVIKRHIESALKQTNGKIHGDDGAGALLGVNPNTLRYKMRKLGIPFGKKKG